MMIDVAMEINMIARMGKSAKKLPFNAIQSLIQFQQYFVQGMWTHDDPLYQLPGFEDESDIKAYKKLVKEHQVNDSQIQTLCNLTPGQRKEMNLFGGDKAKNA